MKRTLPVYTIEGTQFLVDINRQELRQVDQPDNVISFPKDMTDMGTYYTLAYDREQKNYPHNTEGRHNIVEITLPSMVVLDPEGMAEKFGYKVADLKGKSDFDILVNPELLAERHEGKLPVLWIDGYEFLVDVNKNELRPMDGLTRPIPLRIFNFADEGYRYQDYYHMIERRLVEIDLKMMALPENVTQIRIPNVLFLDPVGVANRYAIDENFLLRRYPLQKDYQAELIPLRQTHLLDLARINQYEWERKERAMLQQSDKQTRRNRPKF